MRSLPDHRDAVHLEGALRLQRSGFRLDTGPFSLPLDGITAVFGPSGSGKSTWLRAIAGLEPSCRGQLRAGEVVWHDDARQLPSRARGVGMVFQDAALFPHRDVLGNLRLATRWAARDDAASAIADVATQTGIGALLGHRVGALSGGERQRVAIARALLARPRLLCLDEPLSALDRPARASLLELLTTLCREHRLPMLYVTHAAEEVERIADRVVCMQGGQIIAIESLASSLTRPDSPLFADDGAVSVLHGALEPQADAEHAREGLRHFVHANEHGHIRFALLADQRLPTGLRRLRVRARDVAVARQALADSSLLNQLPATLLALHADGTRCLLTLRLADGQTLLAEISRHSAERLGLRAGDALHALVKSAALGD